MSRSSRRRASERGCSFPCGALLFLLAAATVMVARVLPHSRPRGAGLEGWPARPAAAPGGAWQGRCVGVANGDTITVLHEGRPEKIRLNAAWCPNTRQPFGTTATRFTSKLVLGKAVTVKPVKIDAYGRTVAAVFTDTGRSLEEALVAAGLAWWARQYAPDDRRLEALEAQARAERRGLWADPNPVAPWDFRR